MPATMDAAIRAIRRSQQVHSEAITPKDAAFSPRSPTRAAANAPSAGGDSSGGTDRDGASAGGRTQRRNKRRFSLSRFHSSGSSKLGDTAPSVTAKSLPLIFSNRSRTESDADFAFDAVSLPGQLDPHSRGLRKPTGSPGSPQYANLANAGALAEELRIELGSCVDSFQAKLEQLVRGQPPTDQSQEPRHGIEVQTAPALRVSTEDLFNAIHGGENDASDCNSSLADDEESFHSERVTSALFQRDPRRLPSKTSVRSSGGVRAGCPTPSPPPTAFGSPSHRDRAPTLKSVHDLNALITDQLFDTHSLNDLPELQVLRRRHQRCASEGDEIRRAEDSDRFTGILDDASVVYPSGGRPSPDSPNQTTPSSPFHAKEYVSTPSPEARRRVSLESRDSEDGASPNQTPRRLCSKGFASNNSAESRTSVRTRTILSDKSMSGLRVHHESMILDPLNITMDGEAAPTRAADAPRNSTFPTLAMLLLRCFGVVPFSEFVGCCSRLLVLVPAGLFAFSLSRTHTDVLYVQLCTACFAFGGLLGIFCLWLQRLGDLMGPRRRPFETYAIECGFTEDWRRASVRRVLVVVAVWFTCCASKVSAYLLVRTGHWSFDDCPEAVSTTWSLAAFVPCSGALVVLMYCQLHICSGSQLAIDSFCIRFFEEADLPMGVSEWNLLQAMLRRAANSVETCFLTLTISSLALLMLTGTQVIQRGHASATCYVHWFGWIFPPIILKLYVVFQAAAVSEKCSRVPALVNSWNFRDIRPELDQNRQYVVQYIAHSHAGFYVKGVRLCGVMAFKLAYVLGAVVFTFLMQSLFRKQDDV